MAEKDYFWSGKVDGFMKRLLFKYGMLLCMLCFVCPVLRAGGTMPDSLLTIDHVYNVTFTDPDLGHRILREMRSRKMYTPYELNLAEGDLYVNNYKYQQAMVYYRRILNSDSVRLNRKNRLGLYHRMVTCFDGIHDEDGKERCARLLLKEAEAEKDAPMQSVALFAIGKSLRYQGDTARAYDYMQRAIHAMEASDYAYKFDNLRYEYNTLFLFLLNEHRYEEALAVLGKLEKIVDASGDGKEIAGLASKERKTLYANKAVVLQCLGREDEAERCYRLWENTAKEYTNDDYLILPYLFAKGRYDEVIRKFHAREAELRRQGDTVNYHMRTALRYQGKAYMEKGDYEMAAFYYRRLAEITKLLKEEEQQSLAIELATIYEVNEKDAIIEWQGVQLQRHEVTFYSVIALLVSLGIIVGIDMYNRRIIFRKNKVLVKQIEKNESLEAFGQEPLEAGGVQESTSPDECALFGKLEALMRREKLYRNSKLTRDDIVARLYTNKNALINALQKYAGSGFTDYVNALRLDDAVELMKACPEMTIEHVAEQVGFGSVVSLYRQFKCRYGLTPAEFRKALDEESGQPEEIAQQS